MSAANETNDTAAVKARAAAWLEQRDRANWNSADQAALDTWLAQSLSHSIAFWRLDAAWERTERLAALRSSDAVITDAPRAKRRRPFYSVIASAFALLCVIGVANRNYVLGSTERVYATPVGGHKIVTLNDGSQIELNTDTQLRADVDSRGRLVSLDRGEAYFEIKHDVTHPFVVMAGNHRIVDLGTKFLIRRDGRRLRVSLMEGRVQFDATDNMAKPVSIEMNPGDVVVAENDHVSAARKTPAALASELGWEHGVVVFDNTTLADAAVEFNRYGGRKLVIADASIGHMKIDGTFQTGNVGAFADAVQDALGLHLINHPGEVIISR
ncbi:MAG TPA: FecR domain-containing protein [Rhizomicrobium sp.]|nr:FecR domain-containing protein [Rhizomicrobium sp.]